MQTLGLFKNQEAPSAKETDGRPHIEFLPAPATREKMTITPDDARHFLETYEANVEKDKSYLRPPLSEKDYKAYAEAMKNDGWVYNGIPIIFDENGVLLDGRHRLKAIIESGKPATVLVSRGVRRDVMHTIAQHRRRNFAQLLESRGVKNAPVVVRTLVKLFRIQNGTEMKWSLRPSNHRMNLILEKNPFILRGVEIAQDFKDLRKYTNGFSFPVFTSMAVAAGHEEKLKSFLMDLRHRIGGVDHPPFKLGLKVDTLLGMGGNLSPHEGLAYAILFFNEYIMDIKSTDQQRWQPNYGRAEIRKGTNEPKSRVDLITQAPPNCGLPEMIGYPGLEEAVMSIEELRKDSEFAGDIADVLKSGAKKDIDKSEIFDVTITSEVADFLLQFNTNNRKAQKTHFENLAKDIRNGYWMQNEQPIAFTGNPFSPDATPENCVLLNGQHRLMAVKHSDQMIESPIVTNVPVEAFPTYDNHAKRSTIAGVSDGDARVLHAAAKFQWMRDNDIPYMISSTKYVSPTETELKKTLEYHANYVEALATARKQVNNNSLEKMATTGVMAHFVYVARCDHPDVAEEFFEELRSGVSQDVKSPVIGLRNTLAALKAGGGSRKQKIVALFEAWHKYLEWRDVDPSNMDLKKHLLREPKKGRQAVD